MWKKHVPSEKEEKVDIDLFRLIRYGEIHLVLKAEGEKRCICDVLEIIHKFQI
jgi:hypothetical protein